MKKYFTSSNILFSITVLVCIGTIFTLFSDISGFAFHVFFNSDTLYLPSIYKDIFIEHNSLEGWHFNPSPNFFPDMIVYFIIMAITSDFISASFVFAIIQYSFFIYLIYRLFKTIDLPNPKMIAALSNLLLLLFFMVSFYSNDFGFAFFLVSNSYHTGAFLMSLFCTILAIEYLKHTKIQTLVYLAIILFLCVLSDRLFIVLFSIPWLFAMLLYFKIENRKQLLWLNIINILSVIAGMFVFDLLESSSYIYIDSPHRIMDYKYIEDSAKLLSEQMSVYIMNWDFKSLIIIISIITFISIIVISIKTYFNKKKLDAKDLYYVLSIVFTLAVFLAPVINGSYTGFDTIRYNIYVFYVLVINSGIIIYFFIQRLNVFPTKIIKGLVIVLLFGASLNVLCQFKYEKFINYFSYYPKTVESIDEISKKEELYCGLGNYWTAKVVTMFSKNNVRVYTSRKSLTPNCHVMNENWYINGRFNFVISNNEKQDSLLNNLFDNNTRLVKYRDVKLVLTPEFGYNSSLKKIDY